MFHSLNVFLMNWKCVGLSFSFCSGFDLVSFSSLSGFDLFPSIVWFFFLNLECCVIARSVKSVNNPPHSM